MTRCQLRKTETLADYPRECIEIAPSIKEEEANTILDAAYKNVLPEMDASYFTIEVARLFRYPKEKKPILKFWVVDITDKNKWYDEMSRLGRALHSPIRYDVKIAEF